MTTVEKTLWTETVPRRSGKHYQARKAPRTEMLQDAYGDLTTVIVWRTHDIDVAVALAGDMWRREVGDPLPSHAFAGWFRTVPWSSTGADWDVINVPEAERGATPAVIFR